WLFRKRIDPQDVTRSLAALQKLGVPYMDVTEENVTRALAGQANGIARNLRSMNIETDSDLEIIAVIAYLQRLGQDGRRALAPADEPGPAPGAGEAALPAGDPHAFRATSIPPAAGGGSR